MLADALARGDPFRPGPAVEIASGTSLVTPSDYGGVTGGGRRGPI